MLNIFNLSFLQAKLLKRAQLGEENITDFMRISAWNKTFGSVLSNFNIIWELSKTNYFLNLKSYFILKS